ncbi:hypothetical protein R2325_14035 [Mycobacteroides chelonae]|nr:hypothetical protein [Mycobacteroides chelonae]MEC4873145.1 hypothetical protein [Mycobacteroides chelonae]
MAHTDVKNTFVGRPMVSGGIWRVPQNIVLPTTAYDTRPVSSIRLGGVSDEGYTYSSERQTDKKKDWNGDKVRSVQQSKDDTFELTFIEFLNPRVMEVVYGTDNVTVTPANASHGTHIAVKSVADVLDHGAYIIDTFDGKVKRRRCIPDAQPDKIEPIGEKPGDWSVYKVTFDLFPDSQGATNYLYTELNDKLVPTNWTVTVVAGSTPGGGFTAAVNGGTPTASVAYNAASSVFQTALTNLLGADKATVSGSAGGPYAVTLTDGGVLSVDGTGLTGTGASVTAVSA